MQVLLCALVTMQKKYMKSYYMKKDLFDSIFEEFKESTRAQAGMDPLTENYLTEEMDHEILKQRDAHFAGDFKVMHQYYQQDGLRQHPDIDLERIEYLAQIEAE